jgi:hypothetical protein
MQRFLLPRGYLSSLHFEFYQAFKEYEFFTNSSKTRKGDDTSEFTLCSQSYVYMKCNRKLQIKIPHEYRHRNPNKILSN